MPMPSRFLPATALLLLVCCPWAPADEPATVPDMNANNGPLPGHSAHGEAFDDGPRQAARLLPGTGKINFAATSKSPEAQAFINQGVGQLHGFWYFEAERSFRQAAASDADCAIAYWGMAMANINNDKRGKAFIAEAIKRRATAGEGERLYIDALDNYFKIDPKKKKERNTAYIEALENIVNLHPRDLDAKAWLVLAMWQSRSEGVPIVSYLAIDALLSEIFAAEPAHPAHHYRIHLWDDKRASKALESAAQCGQAAPGIAHMWHMPGHTFSKLNRYHDAAWQQEASARVDHAYMQRDRVLPDQIHNFAHNNEWLIRNLIYTGASRQALALAKNMISLPRHPKYNAQEKRGSYHFGRLRTFDVLAKFELWQETIELAETTFLESTGDDAEQVKLERAVGRAQLMLGDLEAGKKTLAKLEEQLGRQKTARVDAEKAAEEKVREEKKEAKDLPKLVDKAKADARKPYLSKIENREKAVAELQGRLAVIEGDAQRGLEPLKKSGLDTLSLARVQLAAGEKEAAEKAVRAQVASRKNEVLPLAALAETLWAIDKRDEAKKTFEQLRAVSSAIDIDCPPFARLAPIAEQLGLSADWRQPRELPGDVGVRPPLESLGPAHWTPSAAPAWQLPDAEGKEHSSQNYAGKPVVILFYLGFGCVHCVEQLQAFAPLAKEFEDAGISLIAISTDDAAGLTKTLAKCEEGKFALPLVADPELTAFKAYRAYDDFEKQALHATFFIDAAGRVRWQDISAEPFTDAKFVLGEAKRLLAIELKP